MIQLERIGPFIPPLFFPGLDDIVATEWFLSQLKQSDYQEWSTRPVIKQHIVYSEWDGTQRIKESGEPEDVILSGKHDPVVADSIGNLAEIVLPSRGVCSEIQYSEDYSCLTLLCTEFSGGDWFTVSLPGGNSVLCSPRFREWLATLDNVSKWIAYFPVAVILKNNSRRFP